ncbi:hypothetical protein KQX54_003596 [Cotesia glomerata]|uniref:Uncharacterized protein n=1 Tax=Cotesia glomerata TaxID=32391 RepID=A0AAV7ILW0_COTGL|nr:hypothetical protein KQX54_003596 [Cotesia glomerata]
MERKVDVGGAASELGILRILLGYFIVGLLKRDNLIYEGFTESGSRPPCRSSAILSSSRPYLGTQSSYFPGSSYLIDIDRQHLHLFMATDDIIPINAEGYPATKEFLSKVVDILLDYVKTQNDRNSKVLEFHHPADLMRILDLEIPDNGLTLQQLLIDCSTTLKYQHTPALNSPEIRYAAGDSWASFHPSPSSFALPPLTPYRTEPQAVYTHVMCYGCDK